MDATSGHLIPRCRHKDATGYYYLFALTHDSSEPRWGKMTRSKINRSGVRQDLGAYRTHSLRDLFGGAMETTTEEGEGYEWRGMEKRESLWGKGSGSGEFIVLEENSEL